MRIKQKYTVQNDDSLYHYWAACKAYYRVIHKYIGKSVISTLRNCHSDIFWQELNFRLFCQQNWHSLVAVFIFWFFFGCDFKNNCDIHGKKDKNKEYSFSFISVITTLFFQSQYKMRAYSSPEIQLCKFMLYHTSSSPQNNPQFLEWFD